MRRRHRRRQVIPELDITAFLNLMIVLVPVLLISMVFTQTRAIGMDFSQDAGDIRPQDEEKLQLRVTLRDGVIVVADNQQGLIERIEPGIEGPDFAALTETLREIKTRVPEKRDIALLAEPATEYQVLVSAMDAIRSYPAVVVADVVQAELFPDIALGDAPAEPGPGESE